MSRTLLVQANSNGQHSSVVVGVLIAGAHAKYKPLAVVHVGGCIPTAPPVLHPDKAIERK